MFQCSVVFLIHVSGMLSATASLGLILLWDVDGGLTQIDKFLYASEDYIKVIVSLCFIYASLISEIEHATSTSQSIHTLFKNAQAEL